MNASGAQPFVRLLREARQAGATDLILMAGSAPYIYVAGRMRPFGPDPLNAAALDGLMLPLLDDDQRCKLVEQRDLDFSLRATELGSCRVNVHYQRQSLAAAVRFVPDSIPTLASIGLPEVIGQFVEYSRGLVLVTGGTGTGKSTTLAAMIDRINRQRAAHIITLEDPIEYAFHNDRSIIEQREIGDDAPTFASALRHVVRQKPDVILIGELRDLETIATALTAAETGHLVLASLHTVSAAQTVERIVDVFEARRQPQVRLQLANTLRAIVCQVLLPAAEPQPLAAPKAVDGRSTPPTGGSGLVAAVEILVTTPAIRRAIRDNETHLVPGMIETGGRLGMRTLDASLAEAVTAGRIRRADALSAAADPEKLERLLGQEGGARELITASATVRKPWE